MGGGKTARALVTPEHFRRARKESGLSQKEAAELCGVHERTYQSWEAGEITRLRLAYLNLIRQR